MSASGSESRPSLARRGRRRLRLTVQWPMVVWLTLVWWVLWGSYSAMSLAGGVLVALVLLVALPLPPLSLGVRVRPWPLLVLVARFLADVVVASVQVAVTVVRPPADLRGAMVAVRLRSHSDLVLVVVAEMVSLVPGSVVVEARRSTHTLYLHVLDARDPEVFDRVRERVWAQESRIVAALAADDDHTDREHGDRVVGS